MKKLKRQYRGRQEYNSRYNSEWALYPRVRNRIFKHFSTKQEKSYYFLHQVECKDYPIKLRAARGRALANPWDDYRSDVYELARCWKHNSKRRKQYYR
ncbi:hypothetical protein LRP52_00010 [Photobacterium sp. ZSDE20]|uniref:Uncharacterized protein n=1 Tax=Photobacterium pectinilyticum TaxID=2906793 RepID=A0ABT1MVP8_9GAMM|nr:hypothetical protein [Photobacterium sp. ZSDE20]MCQ1056449.1 hypothetical protein [Photobacterium sp. ZSDE20]MDD1820584.1 hypothetical protein [Photobacterium sp. ZSDE20]